ncbi:MAG TPA: RidA family protein, partial [Aestuariivirga sp.]|nr:RidA family protein [Aestuariivirga sp.]
MGLINKRLAELGIVLPTPAKPIANYVPWVKTGNLVYISGQGAMKDGKLQYTGKVGDTVSIEDAIASARLTGINIISHLRDACGGDLDRVKRIVKLLGLVNCTATFGEHPKVINGASDLMVEVFGDKGRHARSAVGAPSL